MGKIRFSAEDLDLFRAASHDHNPLHSSEEYARRTPFGGRVVFGVLNALQALKLVGERPGQALSSVELDFFDAALLDVEYSQDLQQAHSSETSIAVRDGRRPLLDGLLRFRDETRLDFVPASEWKPGSLEPKDLTSADLTAGQRVIGSYAPARTEFEVFWSRLGVAGSWFTRAHLAALMWASYLIGMELPGRRALFSRLVIDFEGPASLESPFQYLAEIAEIGSMGELTIQAQLSSAGRTWAQVNLGAHVRDEIVPASTATVEALVGRSDAFRGKVALVTGASRGLGAALVRAITLHGATVVVNFLRSQSLAEQLRDSLAGTPGTVLLDGGNTASPEWCEAAAKRIAAQFHRLDFLICNASPPLLPLWLEAEAQKRVTQFVHTSLDMVTSPMMAFLPLLATHKGWNVLVSSVAVLEPHPHFPHYVIAKAAAEAAVRAASVEYRTVSSLIVRPARLLTDLTNTPMARKGALRPEHVASAIVRRIQGPTCPGRVELLDQFS